MLNVRTIFQITFLEFFEALLGCAEVKNTHGVGTAQHRQCEMGYPDQTSPGDQMKNSLILSQLASAQVCAHAMIQLSLQLYFNTSVQKCGM